MLFRMERTSPLVIILFMAAITVRPVSGEEPQATTEINIRPLEKKTGTVAAGPPAIRSKYFYLERPRVDLNLSYELNSEQLTNLGEESDDTVHEFREGFGLETTGWLYHPALMTFDLDLYPEWIQSPDSNQYTGDESDTGYLNGYSLDADLLPLKPYTLHLFGRKYQNSFRNTFQERAVIDTDAYGATLALKYQVLPTTLSYSNVKTDNRGTLTSSLDQDLFNLGMIHQKPDTITRLTAYYRDSLQTNEGEENRLKSARTYLNSNHFIQRDLIKRLTSDLSYNWTENGVEDGDVSFTYNDFRWTENLYWTHRDNLWTNYNFLFENQETDGSTVNIGEIGASLSHLLYENLTTTISGEASHTDYTVGTDTIYSGGLDFDYIRAIPWGTLNLKTGFDAALTQRDSGNEGIWVANEQYTATFGSIDFLQQENVDPDSIRVTNATGSILYIQGQDYTVEVSGTLVRIRPTLFGNISDGQELLVSYRYNSGGTYDDIIYGRWAGINVFLWSTLRLSYDYYRRTQDVVSGTNPNTAIDETVHRTQARVLWRWTDTTLSYDVYETLLASARSTWRLNEQLTFQPARGVLLDFSGYLGSTQFTYTDEQEDFYRVSARMSWAPTYWCTTGIEAYQYDISGNVENNANGGFLAFADVFYGKWTLNLSYRYLDDTYEGRDYQRYRQGFLVRLSRSFW